MSNVLTKGTALCCLNFPADVVGRGIKALNTFAELGAVCLACRSALRANCILKGDLFMNALVRARKFQ